MTTVKEKTRFSLTETAWRYSIPQPIHSFIRPLGTFSTAEKIAPKEERRGNGGGITLFFPNRKNASDRERERMEWFSYCLVLPALGHERRSGIPGMGSAGGQWQVGLDGWSWTRSWMHDNNVWHRFTNTQVQVGVLALTMTEEEWD